ncbi:hypothetical protein GCK32_002315 [Trichostrongylus colubriformis]|uniref:Uncharacterized protein n=1 Tax=Trichostrongylus colubriformis TaxID=6319 RepID=A0AAN8J199_TRICO
MVLDEELMDVNAHASRSMDENGASPTVGGSEEAPPQVSVKPREFSVVEISEELERALGRVELIPQKISEELEEARIAGKYRTKLFHVLESEVGVNLTHERDRVDERLDGVL